MRRVVTELLDVLRMMYIWDGYGDNLSAGLTERSSAIRKAGETMQAKGDAALANCVQ